MTLAAVCFLQYICPLKYGVNLMCILEWNPDEDPLVNELIFESNGIKVSDKWIYVGVLLAVFVCFRIIALLALVKKASSF